MAENINCIPTDYKFTDQIDDTVQVLKFYPVAGQNILASGGWDCKLRIWNVQYQVNTNNMNSMYRTNHVQPPPEVNYMAPMISAQTFQNPILSLAWKANTSQVYVSDCEGGIFSHDVQTNQTTQIGSHKAGCKELAFHETNQMSILISAGWDGFLNFWDLRQQNPVLSISMNKKIYSMSLSNNLLVIGMEKRMISYFNLLKLGGNNFVKEAEFESHLKYQTRCVAAFSQGCGYAIGSIEGRIAIKNIDFNKLPGIDQKTNIMTEQGDFAFRTHRSGNNNSDVYAVNQIAFNKPYGTFASCGGDGTFFIWDKNSKARLKIGQNEDKAPITAIDFSANGEILAYASGYDWSKGLNGENLHKPRLGLHYLIEDERKQKSQQPNINQGNNTVFRK